MLRGYFCLFVVLVAVLIGSAQEKTIPQDDNKPRKEEEKARIDSYGDPLPVGALTRLGKKDAPSGGDSLRWRSVTFSPDNAVVAACAFGDKATGRILFWDIKTGHKIRALSEPRRHTWTIAFTPDGKSLVSSSGDNTLILWDLATRQPVFAKRGSINYNGMGGAPCLPLSPDGRTIAHKPILGIHRSPAGMYLWETASGQEWAEIRAPNDPSAPILPLAFSPDGRLLALNFQHGIIHLLDLANGKFIRTFGAPVDSVNVFFPRFALFSPDAASIIAVGSDQTASRSPGTERPLRVWEAATGKERLRFRGHSPLETYAALSPDGTVLASANGCEHQAYLWDIQTGRELAKLEGHGKPINSLAFSPDGKLLATASEDRSILIWDLAKLPGVKRVLAPKPVRIVQLAEKPKEPLTKDETKNLWSDLADKDGKKAYRAIWSLALHPDQSLPLLRQLLRPIPRPDPRQVERWIANLGSADFDEREAAAKKLEELSDTAAAAMRRALDNKPPLETRKRLEPLLAKLQRPYTSPQRLRTFRALEVLEHVGNDEARKILLAMAEGAPEAAETQDAKASLQRLALRRPAEKR